ncbi:unnamed protein product, partial [Lampetra planeri]
SLVLWIVGGGGGIVAGGWMRREASISAAAVDGDVAPAAAPVAGSLLESLVPGARGSSRLRVDFALSRDDLFQWEQRTRGLGGQSRGGLAGSDGGPAGERGGPAGEREGPVGERGGPAGEREGPVGERGGPAGSLLQESLAVVRALEEEKERWEQELRAARNRFLLHMRRIGCRLLHVQEELRRALEQGHVIPQRRHLELWHRHVQDITAAHLEEMAELDQDAEERGVGGQRGEGSEG